MLKCLKACHVRAKKETAVQRGHVQMHENLAMCKQDCVTPSLSLFASALESTVYL